MKHRKCEFCQTPLKPSNEWTVCAPCDRSMKSQQSLELTVKEQKWAATHKCRKCHVGLPLSRYFECLACNDPYTIETESEFDACDDMVWENA